jgi:hypothetical protein
MWWRPCGRSSGGKPRDHIDATTIEPRIGYLLGEPRTRRTQSQAKRSIAKTRSAASFINFVKKCKKSSPNGSYTVNPLKR